MLNRTVAGSGGNDIVTYYSGLGVARSAGNTIATFVAPTIGQGLSFKAYSCSGGGCFYTPSTPENFSITAKDIYNDTSIQNFTVDIEGLGTYNTPTGTLTTPILSNSTQLWNITAYSTNYFNNETLNINVSSNYTFYIRPYTKIFARNGNTNASIQNFTAYWNGTNYTTTDNRIYLPLYNLINSNITVYSDGYNTDSGLVNASPYLENYTIDIFPYPSSVTVRIYDQEDGSKLLENITLVVSGTSFEETFSTTSGYYFIGNLTAGIHTFKFSGANYTTQTYTVTIGDNTHQYLNAFLAKNTSSVTFTSVDFDSYSSIEGVSASQQRLISNVWTTVASKETDITGRVQFPFVTDVKYKFIFSKSGYATKSFELDPVIFTSYTVRMNKEITQQDETIFSGVSWEILPNRFVSDTAYNLSFFISNPDGALESYGILAEYPGDGPKTTSGSNAYGETLSVPVVVNATGYQQTVNITFWYDTTLTGNRTYTRYYLIEYDSTDGTFEQMSETEYGMTTLEKALVATMVIVLVAGFGFAFGGPLAGGLVAIFMFWWAYKLGFLSLWMILPGTLVAVVLIMWRSSR